MLIKAEQKFIHISPRKMRRVVDVIRHLRPQTALTHLDAIGNPASLIVTKTINQALANATNNHQLNPDSLRFHRLEVNQSSTFKRFMAASRGRAHAIQKKTSHLKVVLESPTGTTSIQPPAQPATLKKTTPRQLEKPASKPAKTSAISKAPKQATRSKSSKKS